MKTIAVIAEFNPFHNGHLHLIETCKKNLQADHVVVVMSGDFVQRGTPSFCDKFTRTRMALLNGVDAVFELPIYYSTGSAEFFATGAVSLLEKLGCIDYLCFGSECADTSLLSQIADILNKEPASYKKALSQSLKGGSTFAKARHEALLNYLDSSNIKYKKSDVTSALSSPNNILGIEYIKALHKLNSKIVPYSIKRQGNDYNSQEFSELSSASAIRTHILENGISSDLFLTMPKDCISLLKENVSTMSQFSKLSELMHYKLISEKDKGYTRFMDVSPDLSNKILTNLEKYTDFDGFCMLLKSKDITYSRISRSLIHILLNITNESMDTYRNDGYTTPLRLLGMKKDNSSLLKEMKETSKSPVITSLKQAKNLLSDNEFALLCDTLNASEIYGLLCSKGPVNEYRQKQIIL